MSARVLPVVLAFAVALSAVSLAPPAPAAAAPGGGVSQAEARSAVQAALVDVDWPTLTRTADGSATAQSVDAEARGRAAVRAELALDGSSASAGADATTGGQALQRIGALGNRWTDTCGEPGVGRVDLRATLLAQSIDNAGRQDQTGFLAYACDPWQPADLGDGSISWGLYVCHDPETDEAGPLACPVHPEEAPDPAATFPDFVVAIFADGADLRIAAVRTPSDDTDSWYVTWVGDAQRLDDYEVDGVVPTKAIGDLQAKDFAFLTMVVDADDDLDVFPEPYMTQLPAFPRACEGELALAQAARVPLATAAVIPDDPEYPRQWGLPAVGAPAAWERRTDADVLVAVVDDGVDGRRADFGDRVVAGYDSVYGQDLPASSDSNRGNHGTAVAAVLAAAGNNATEVAGVNWGARILPIRVVDVNGCIGATAVADAIDHARERGAQVINLSLGGPDHPAVRAAVDRARSAGMVVVAAAGNYGPDSPPLYPATLPGVIAVGATDRSGKVAAYSSTGRHLDVVAPGGDASGRPDADIVVPWDLGSISAVAGTSFAAPLVAGAVSLYLGEHPHATPEDVAQALARSAVDLGVPGHDIAAGHGLLNISAFLAEAAAGPDPATGQLPRVDVADATALPLRISQLRFPDPATRPAAHVVLSRDDVFADSLAGAALTANGPLLVTPPDQLDAAVLDEIQRVLGGSGTVYLLGGEQALSSAVADALSTAGFTVTRLQGASRVETSVAVAREVQRRSGSQEVAIARAFPAGGDPTSAWADSVTGGAWAAAAGVPVVVTGGSLHPAVAAFLAEGEVSRTVLLGGTAALPNALEAAVPSPQRVSGGERAATAAAVATQLWTAPAGYLVANGFESQGWIVGLAGAGLAADHGTPLLLVDRGRVPDATLDLAATVCGADLTLLGDDRHVGGSAEAALAAVTSC